MPVTYPTMERLLRGVEPEVRSRELTQAEKAQAFLEEQLAKITSRERARRLSMTAFGGADSGIPGGMGAIDVVPFLGSAKGLEEGVRAARQAEYDRASGRYGDAFLNYGASALGMLPGAAGTLRAAPAVGRAVVDLAQSPAAERMAGRLAEATGAGPLSIVPRSDVEQSFLSKFGQKQEQEAARTKKVEKMAKESAGKSPEAKTSKKGGGKREKVEPDYYRTMAADLGDQAVLDAAMAGEHIRPSGSGFIGFPRTVTSKQGITAMRKGIDKDFADSVEAVRLADPDRLGTWYDRAKSGIAETVEPYQLPRVLEQHGVYSAGVSPESELGFALKHLNSRVAGVPQMAYRGAGMRTLDEAVAQDRPARMGFKIKEYANKNDPRLPNTGLFGVNDFRRAQGMQYTDTAGNPWHEGVRDTMHPVMDAETALQVNRANQLGIGGRTDWFGPHIQEVPWVYGKGQDFYYRGKKGRYSGDSDTDGLAGKLLALRDANNTARDYMYKHVATATHEAVPGAGLGHVPQVLSMTPAEKLEYGRQGRWDLPAPEAEMSEFPQVGAGNRDILYGSQGYRQLPSRETMSGMYRNSLGEVENNPMTMARPLMDFPTGGGGGFMDPQSRKMMEALEHFRAFQDAQEAGAFNLPNTMKGVKGKNSMVFDARSLNPNKLADPTASIEPTAQEVTAIDQAIRKLTPKGQDVKFYTSATNRGIVVFPGDPAMDSKEANKFLNKLKKEVAKVYPGTAEKAKTTTGYLPGIGKRGPEGNLSTAPYSGEATSDLLTHFSELPQSVAQNLSESEAVRNQIREKALRDAKLGGARGDIQESRRFFSEADWPKAVKLIREGMTPAAAIAALGYSATSMAGERR